MRNNLPVTQREHHYRDCQRIVSTTTDKGLMTYVNKDFVDISGFSEEELLGQAHNLVRHPDMPQAAFRDLWDTISADKPWMGIVKNRCKNGDHYWVNAFVTPMVADGKTVGYQSVRVKPDAETVARAEALYSDINRGVGVVKRLLSWTPSLQSKIFMVCCVTLLLGGSAGWLLSTLSLTAGLLLSALAGLCGFALSYVIARPWQRAAQQAKSVCDNPIAQQVYTGRGDELGQLELALEFLKAQQNTIIWRSSEAVEKLSDAAAEAGHVTASTENNMDNLNSQVELVSSAMTEMTATVQDVASNASQAASSTQEVCENVAEGQQVVLKTKMIIGNLSTHVEDGSQVVQQLACDSEKIGGVVDVINSIAEQTNLLALNAAIEAARAGEQGRGFAVVADEVRSLAGKTQASTGEIIDMIKSLQDAARRAVEAMSTSQQAANESVEQVDNAELSLNTILQNVHVITDMSTQIATAAEEQSAVAEEINQNVVNINDSGTSTLEGCRRVNKANCNLADGVDKLSSMIVQFGLKS